MRAAYDALKPDGKWLIWLYGFEGNEVYLGTFGVLRTVSKRLPHPLLNGLCSGLNRVLDVYIAGSSVLPLPMHKYMRNHLAKLDRDQRHLTIYDQLNPAYAKYYRRQEAIDLLEKNGFSDVEIAHRHGYSWTVVGTKNV